MTRLRVAAAVAALLTALLLQASVVGPLVLSVPVSLPALLVAAVALVDGAGVGLAFGFAAGLVADLGAEHPAGLLGLCWLVVGTVCGLCASDHASVRRDAALAGLVCGLAGAAALLVLAVVPAAGGRGAVRSGVLGSGVLGSGVLASTARDVVLAVLGNALLALGVVPLVRFFLHSAALRLPRPVLVLGADR